MAEKIADEYSWVPFMEELAFKLLKYEGREQDLAAFTHRRGNFPRKAIGPVELMTLVGTLGHVDLDLLSNIKDTFRMKSSIPSGWDGCLLMMPTTWVMKF